VLRVWPRVLSALAIVVRVVTDLVGWVALAFRSRQSLDAEVLFLRRQLALYVERGVKPRRIDAATRVSLALLSPAVRMALRTGGRAPRDDDPLAPRRLETVLAPVAPSVSRRVRRNGMSFHPSERA